MNTKSELKVDVHFDPERRSATKPIPITKSNENDYHVTSRVPFEVEGTVVLSTSNGKTWEWKIVTVSNWPEFDRRTCHEEIHLPWSDRERIPYPCVWTRKCKKVAYARLTYSGNDSSNIEKAIKECANIGLAAAAPLAVAGQWAAAGVAFLEALKSCLLAKGVNYIGRFNVGVHTTKQCSGWQRV